MCVLSLCVWVCVECVCVHAGGEEDVVEDAVEDGTERWCTERVVEMKVIVKNSYFR